MSNQKKRPLPVRILLKVLMVIAAIVILISVWFAYCSLNRKSALDAIPADYSFYIRTDSFWDAANPLLDLQATDILIATPGLSSSREAIFKFRNSSIRRNFFIQHILKRRIDFAVYDKNVFTSAVDMGILSGITRLAPLLSNWIEVPGLSYIKEGGNSYFVYQNEKVCLYFKVIKNLVIVSSQKELFLQSISLKNKDSFSPKTYSLMKEDCLEPFKIIADGKQFLKMLSSEEIEENDYFKLISDTISEEDLTTIHLSVSDTDISIQANFPFALNEEYENHPIANIIHRNSTIPELLPRLPETIQYYTFLNSGSVEELKNTAFSLAPKNMDVEGIWNTANKASQMLFHITLEDLLYSWTDDEFAVFGLEGKAEPVFAIKVKDEVQRQHIFDNVLSSIILKSNTSLLVDGVRLPSIEVPAFFQSILNLLGISLPKPYYLVTNGYIYFSLSPENLVYINSAAKAQAKLSNSTNWNRVSSKQTLVSTVSLYYDLERSIPFFLKSKSAFANILKLYNIGRIDLSSQDDVMTIQLQAAACNTIASMSIPGFPISIDEKTDSVLCLANTKNNPTVYWLEGKHEINSLNPMTLDRNSVELNNIEWLVEASAATVKATEGEIWAVSKDGLVYLLNKKLEPVTNFPLLTDETITSQPAIYNDKLLFATETGRLCLVDSKGQITKLETGLEDGIKSTPTVNGNKIALYEKGFLGGIHLIKDLNNLDFSTPYMLDGISYGSPCLFTSNGKTLIAFITQSGLLYLIDENLNAVSGFPLQIDDLFYMNVQAADGYIFGLSAEGTLYRVSLDAQVDVIDLPYLKAKSGFLTLKDYDNDGITEVFVCGDGNKIYGFTTALEMLYTFPVSGYGIPVFTDVNGDTYPDCLVLSTDNQLNAYSLE